MSDVQIAGPEEDGGASQSDWENEGGSVDPFGPDEVGGLQAIVQMRIYDLLFAVLDEINPKKAEYLADLHRRGSLFMSSPKFNAQFIDDEQSGAST